MSLENPLWGATKMRGELLKLGIQGAEAPKLEWNNFQTVLPICCLTVGSLPTFLQTD
jgi:hypothetical protein